MCHVYWIHLDTHSDILTEGYIGITSKTPSVRFNEHKCAAKSSDSIIHRAIRKYGKQLKISTLLEGSLDYCLSIEETLRPTENIGWNMAIGGLSGTPHTIETRLKISEAQKSLWTPERREYFSKMKKGLPLSVKTIAAQKEKRKLTPSWLEAKADKDFWTMADVFYEFFKENSNRSRRVFASEFDIPASKFQVILKKFKNNWNPLQDESWIEWSNNYKLNKGT